MKCRKFTKLGLAMFSVTLLLPATAFAYDATWYKTDFWSGEYPNGFTLEQNVAVQIRAKSDVNASRTINCLMNKGATYHPWNHDRVASSKLEFVSFIPTVAYVIKTPDTVMLREDKTDEEKSVSFAKGDEWIYLTYYAEGAFKLSFRGKYYSANQDLLEVSQEKDAKASLEVRNEDEWMKLTCANNAVGWLLLSDVVNQPFFDSPNIIEYGNAKDKQMFTTEILMIKSDIVDKFSRDDFFAIEARLIRN